LCCSLHQAQPVLVEMTMFKLATVVLASLIAVSVAADASARPAEAHQDVRGPWVQLGTKNVNGAIDRDTIEVGRKDGVFTTIEVRVDGSSIWMDEIKVVFGDGQVYEPKTRLIFDKNSRTRAIDLPGNKRIIRKVEFKYGNLPGGGHASIELWGKEG
jgi:hypothetical protein